MIYNFPDVVGGINISSTTIIRLGKKYRNIVGVKLTCADVGKLSRIQAAFVPGKFAAFAGKSDFLLPGMVAGAHGGIVGSANAFPWCHAQVLEAYRNGQLDEAKKLQVILSNADEALMSIGPVGVKATMSHHFGFGSGRGRRPLGTASYLDYPQDVRKPIDEMIAMEKNKSSAV